MSARKKAEAAEEAVKAEVEKLEDEAEALLSKSSDPGVEPVQRTLNKLGLGNHNS